MKVKNIYLVLCVAYFSMGTSAVFGAQPGRLSKLAAAARIAAVQAFKQNATVRKAAAGANVFAHNAHSYLSKYSFLKLVLPIPQKKILEIGKFTLAQKDGIDPVTGEEKPFYTMVYCDGKISEDWQFCKYFSDLAYKPSSDTLLSPADNNKLALATLNSHFKEAIDPPYFSSILPHLTCETDRIFYTQKLIVSGKINYFNPFQLKKIFELLPSEHGSRLALECLAAPFETFWFMHSLVFLIKQLWREQDAFVHAEKLLKSGLLSKQPLSDGGVTIQTILDIFTTPEQKNKFSYYCLQDPSCLSIKYGLVLMEQLLLPSEKAECAERFLVGMDTSYLLRELLEYIPSDRKNVIALRVLEESFAALIDFNQYYLDEKIGIMIQNLTLETDKFRYLERIINTQFMHAKRFLSLLGYLTNEEKNRFVLLKFEKAFDYLAVEWVSYMIQCLSLEKDKMYYTTKFLDDEKYRILEPGQLGERFGSFAQPILEKSFDILSMEQVAVLISHLSGCVQSDWFKKLVTDKKATFLSVCAPLTSVQGPLFSNYSVTRLRQILGWMADDGHTFAHYLRKKESRQDFFDRIRKFTEGEYHKDRIVLYHGQNDLWAFLEELFKALIFTSQGIETPEKFVWLRLTLQPLLTDEQVAEIRTYGALGKNGKEFNKYRFKVLFTNLHVLANYSGSNSLLYTLTNSDQSAGSRFDFDKGVESMFAELGMMEVYKKIRTKEPKFFSRLYDLYKKEVHSRGNIGRLIAFSLPRDTARALCYPSRVGAGVYPLKINGNSTTDITEIADHFEQVPDYNEYCLIAGKCITNPQEAAQAEVVMETFTSAPTKESEVYAKEVYVEFNKMNELIVQLLNEPAA